MSANIFTSICPVILAAGKGSRMNNGQLPKPLHTVGGKPIIDRILGTLSRSLVSNKPLIVVGFQHEVIRKHLGEQAYYSLQTELLGTGHAVKQACETLKNEHPHITHIVVLNGDHPFISTEIIDGLVKSHFDSKSPITITTSVVDDYSGHKENLYSYGRVLRKGGDAVKVVELKDTTEEEKAIKEVNVGYYCFDLAWVSKHVHELHNTNKQKEYYLTDMVGIAIADGQKVNSFRVDPISAIGINTVDQLLKAEEIVARL